MEDSNSHALVGKREAKLAAYVSLTGAIGAALASEAGAVIVANTTPQPFGINGEVNIDFNNDGQIDYQIDHDRYNLNGTNLDYLQLDKNDVSSHLNPYALDILEPFPLNGTERANGDHAYIAQQDEFGGAGFYPEALTHGEMIGPLSNRWDFQEGDNFQNSGDWIRANRLIDEDQMQIDASIGRNVTLPLGTPGWIGLNGEVRYLGVRIDFVDTVSEGYHDDLPHWFGWIGVRIDNEADATGVVTGYAYETELDVPIMAGDTGPALVGDYNGDGAITAADYTIWCDTLGSTTDLRADGDQSLTIDQGDYGVWAAKFGTAGSGGSAAVPEPSAMLLTAISGLAIVGTYVIRKCFA